MRMEQLENEGRSTSNAQNNDDINFWTPKGFTEAYRKDAKEKPMNNLARLNMADFPKFFLGFDRFENLTHNVDQGYPRYNIVKQKEVIA